MKDEIQQIIARLERCDQRLHEVTEGDANFHVNSQIATYSLHLEDVIERLKTIPL